MVKARGDNATLDLLNWEPPRIVERYDEAHVRASTLRARIAKAVGETLKESNTPREEIAARISDWLGENVTRHMLDAYASEAREEHTISVLRLAALIEATGDVRLLQLIAEMFGHSVIEDKYVAWVEIGQLATTKDEIDRALDAARRNVRRRP